MDVHLVVEDLGLARYSSRNGVFVQNIEDIEADLDKFRPDLLHISLHQVDMTLIVLELFAQGA